MKYLLLLAAFVMAVGCESKDPEPFKDTRVVGVHEIAVDAVERLFTEKRAIPYTTDINIEGNVLAVSTVYLDDNITVPTVGASLDYMVEFFDGLEWATDWDKSINEANSVSRVALIYYDDMTIGLLFSYDVVLHKLTFRTYRHA